MVVVYGYGQKPMKLLANQSSKEELFRVQKKNIICNSYGYEVAIVAFDPPTGE